MEFQLIVNLGNDVQEAICTMLRNHNLSKNAAFFTARDLAQNAPKPLNVVAIDPAGAVVGGLIAETQFAWLKVTIMAVAGQSRRCGIGRRLLELAEREAILRGCQYAYLETMEYQAPDFYQKSGYERAAIFPDWDSHGHAKFVFTKEIA